MRRLPMIATLGRIRRELERELTSRLLVAAMLVPIVEATFGWRAHTPLDAPLALHGAILVALLALAPSGEAAGDDDARPPRGLLWLPVPIMAIVLAVVLNMRSNIFYTSRALMEGMAVLLVVHFVGLHLRRMATERREMGLVRAGAASQVARHVWWRHPASRAMAVPFGPAIRLADWLTTMVGWSLLLSWLLIALEHRHPAGPLLICAGGLELLALIVLIPDALLVRKSGPIDSAHPSTTASHLHLVPGDGGRSTRAGGLRRRRRA